jgi:hypothetical protein
VISLHGNPHVSTNMLYYLLDQYISYLKQISYDIANVIFLQSLQYLPMPILTRLTEKHAKNVTRQVHLRLVLDWLGNTEHLEQFTSLPAFMAYIVGSIK